jgi:outer membrane protein
MKKILLFASAALLLVACSKNNKAAEAEAIAPAEGTIPVAIVNGDSIFSQYTLAIELRDELTKKQEDARLNVNEKARKLQNEMVEFQRKLENNAFLSRERAEQEAARLQKKEADIQTLDQNLTQEILELQQTYNLRLRDSINNAISVLNRDGKFQLILSTSSLNDNVLFMDPALDITNDVVEYLNANYTK